jgi:hypothetical protein
MTDSQLKIAVNDASNTQKTIVNAKGLQKTTAEIVVNVHPEFLITEWGHSSNLPPNDGLNENTCWSSKIAPLDPGFTLLTFDTYYKSMAPPYNYTVGV